MKVTKKEAAKEEKPKTKLEELFSGWIFKFIKYIIPTFIAAYALYLTIASQRHLFHEVDVYVTNKNRPISEVIVILDHKQKDTTIADGICIFKDVTTGKHNYTLIYKGIFKNYQRTVYGEGTLKENIEFQFIDTAKIQNKPNLNKPADSSLIKSKKQTKDSILLAKKSSSQHTKNGNKPNYSFEDQPNPELNRLKELLENGQIDPSQDSPPVKLAQVDDKKDTNIEKITPLPRNRNNEEYTPPDYQTRPLVIIEPSYERHPIVPKTKMEKLTMSEYPNYDKPAIYEKRNRKFKVEAANKGNILFWTDCKDCNWNIKLGESTGNSVVVSNYSPNDYPEGSLSFSIISKQKYDLWIYDKRGMGYGPYEVIVQSGESLIFQISKQK